MNGKKRLPVFYIIYFSLIAIFLIALFIGLRVVRTYLADYETALPQYEAERIFETYYAAGDYSALLEQTEVSISSLETKEDLLAWLRTCTAGKTITYSSITTGLDGTIKYIVKADDVKFSAFTLRESGKTSEKGFTLYEADTFTLYCAGNESVTVTAPAGYSVYVNDVLLDDTYRTGTETRDSSWNYMPDGVNGITFVEYYADGLYLSPQSVRVLSADGQECPITAGENNTYTAAIVFSEQLQTEYADYVVSAAQAISAYMQNDGSFSKAAAYIDPESDLYINLRTSLTYFVRSHSSYSFEDVQTSEFYAYDENTFSCRVSFTHVLKRYGSQDYKDYIDTTFFLRRIGDTFLIYDRYNH